MTITYDDDIWSSNAEFTAKTNEQKTRAIKKSNYNLQSLASSLDLFKRKLESNYPYTLTELKQVITGEGVTICGQVFAIEKIEKLEQIINNIKN